MLSDWYLFKTFTFTIVAIITTIVIGNDETSLCYFKFSSPEELIYGLYNKSLRVTALFSSRSYSN